MKPCLGCVNGCAVDEAAAEGECLTPRPRLIRTLLLRPHLNTSCLATQTCVAAEDALAFLAFSPNTLVLLLLPSRQVLSLPITQLNLPTNVPWTDPLSKPL